MARLITRWRRRPSWRETRVASATGVRAVRPRIDPRIWRRRVEVTRQLGRRRVRLALAVMAVFAVASLALLVLHSGFFSAQHVSVEGSLHEDPSTVAAVAGLAEHPPLIDLDPAAMSARLERLPWVRTATVEVRWPDSVVVRIAERVPVATIGSAPRLALVDGSGRVLAYVAAPPPTTVSLEVEHTSQHLGAPGSSLPAVDAPALSVARGVPPVLEGRVRSVMLSARGSVTLDLGQGITASLGTVSQLPEKFEALASVLAGAHIKAPALIDLTVPDEPTVTPG